MARKMRVSISGPTKYKNENAPCVRPTKYPQSNAQAASMQYSRAENVAIGNSEIFTSKMPNFYTENISRDYNPCCRNDQGCGT